MHPKYRPDIDGLRAIAVGSVLAYHAFPSLLPGGFIGVDIFFVISGFLITTILLQSLAAGDFSYRDFYARRIRRIFPALVLVLLATLAFGWYVLLPGEFSQLGKQTTGGAAFFANLVFLGEAGYFDASAETKPLLHLWSLGIEEQFYIFWPLMLGLAWRRRWPMLRVVLAVAVISFLVNVLTVQAHRAAAFYSPLSRAWELMAGGLLAVMQLQSVAQGAATARAWKKHLQSIVGIALIVLGLFMTRSTKAFPGWWALLPVLGAASCIAAGPGGVLNRYLLSNRVMVWIGLISYPLYLWHWPLLSYARIVTGGEPPLQLRIVLVAASVVLAWATYRFLERFVKLHLSQAILRGLAGAGAALALAGVLVFLGTPMPRHDSPALQAVADATREDNYYDGFEEAALGNQFVYRAGSGKHNVLLIGDSHVEQYAPRALELVRTQPDKARTIYFATKGSCPPVPGLFSGPDTGCDERRTAVLDLALKPEIDSVVLGACWSCYFTGAGPTVNYFVDDRKAVHPFIGGDGIDQSLKSLGEVLKRLSAHKPVYLVLGNPVGMDFDPLRQIEGSRLGRMTAESGQLKAPMPQDQAQFNARLKQVAQANGAKVIEPFASLCADGECIRSMPDDGSPAYKDIGHLRPRYARSFATYIDPALLDEGAVGK
ncbi:acyltransferase family protein [Variovorax guangxiensis]|uniref:Peptidoglycan/LPS O-acetylase OafA/YrhL n=1 Tax=Variovorax guangxiensis TaxID=1775474 RepID=A0A840G0V7_9BURK|nr:acyltransferase family protein [Variovorax guangxiensis]MBB4225400.1 peptidoglycan/LPS O-acetylase OafA/YrhL [Variovorax guangxiensis]